MNYYLNKDDMIKKIFENIKKTDIKPGIMIASISKSSPNYYYHWTRDSSIVMKIIVKHYNNLLSKNENDEIIFKHIIDYVQNENILQNINTISGIGEPKFNVDRTPFNERWGRPQNDGPALRGLTLIKIYKILQNDYPAICNIIIEILEKDLEYILKNYDYPCFDLWEEINGYHLYTRMVQCKFLKEVKNILVNKIIEVDSVLFKLKKLLKHHDFYYTSYDTLGNPCRTYDISLLLGLNHIDYDLEIFDFRNSDFLNYMNEIKLYFKNRYPINQDLNFTLFGRYKNDKYYDGNPWIITTAAFYQTLLKFYDYSNNNPQLFDNNLNFNIEEKQKVRYEVENFLEYISKFKNLDIDEQINQFTGKMESAKKLTWNYSELYNLIELL